MQYLLFNPIKEKRSWAEWKTKMVQSHIQEQKNTVRYQQITQGVFFQQASELLGMQPMHKLGASGMET